MSSGTGYSGNNRHKTGDIHIKKESSSQRPLEITVAKKPRYSYPFGLGTYLMNGCYQYIGMSEYTQTKQQKPSEEAVQPNQPMDYEAPASRKKRHSFQNQTNDMRAFCSRYASLEQTIECKVSQNVFKLIQT